MMFGSVNIAGIVSSFHPHGGGAEYAAIPQRMESNYYTRWSAQLSSKLGGPHPNLRSQHPLLRLFTSSFPGFNALIYSPNDGPAHSFILLLFCFV